MIKITILFLILVYPPTLQAGTYEKALTKLEDEVNYMIRDWGASGIKLRYTFKEYKGKLGTVSGGITKVEGVLYVENASGKELHEQSISTRDIDDMKRILEKDNDLELENFRSAEVGGSDGSVAEYLQRQPQYSSVKFKSLIIDQQRWIERVSTYVNSKNNLPDDMDPAQVRQKVYEWTLAAFKEYAGADTVLTNIESKSYRERNFRDDLTVYFPAGKRKLELSLLFEGTEPYDAKDPQVIGNLAGTRLATQFIREFQFRPLYAKTVGMGNSPLVSFSFAACNDYEARFFGAEKRTSAPQQPQIRFDPNNN